MNNRMAELIEITKKMADELQEFVSKDEDEGFHPASAEEVLQEWNDFCLETDRD
ncbi:MAG: hypothetical protein AB2604_10735 [Candidatus Thiodiazotropha taylori]